MGVNFFYIHGEVLGLFQRRFELFFVRVKNRIKTGASQLLQIHLARQVTPSSPTLLPQEKGAKSPLLRERVG